MRRWYAVQDKEESCGISWTEPFGNSHDQGRTRGRLTTFKNSPKVLSTSGEEEKRRLDDILERILQAADVIPVGLGIIRAATTIQKRRDLSPQDAIVYASVLDHLASVPKALRCFINRNSKDFLNPDIESELAAYNCRLLTRFADGLGYVRHQL